MTASEALQKLQIGNQRFVTGLRLSRDLMHEVKASAVAPASFAVVLGCVDSRVPPELVFDLGIGDIFCPRVAGNIANVDILASIELATKLGGAQLVVVLGHTDCAAVRCACDGVDFGHLRESLQQLDPAFRAVDGYEGERTSGNPDYVARVAEANVRLTVQGLSERSEVLRQLIDRGQVAIVGAMHDVATGRVTFLSET